ncbi:MAG TPA: S8 family serine peptidase [Candidatus Limnocylindrales bacterium]
MKLRLLALGAAAVTFAAFSGAPAGGAPPAEGVILAANSSTAISGSYIVVLNDVVAAASVHASATGLANRYGALVRETWQDALKGFHANMSAAQARRLAADPSVKYVEQDQVMTISDTQVNPPSWGLDRIDQRNLPLNQSYAHPNHGEGVTAYIIDTGIRTTHNDFGGRATWGTNTTGDGNNTDCNGHGTHVASTTGGTAYGVAKAVSLVAVKVLNCAGSGSTTGVIAGIDYVTSNHQPGVPAVANMSLGGGLSTAQNNAVTNSINDGVVYAVAAGNSNANACNFSPASTPAAITLGATQSNDARASFSNFGTCLDLFTPGVSITAAWMTSNTATNTISGTSMASPHAAGIAAIIKRANPSFTPAQVRDSMVADATTNVVTNPGTGSPNRLGFVTGGTTQPPGTTVFFDNFETSLGWGTNPNGTDTATTGAWERGDPGQTTSGVVLQLGTTVSGTNDLVTGAAAGTSAGAFDVDGGVTSSRSPAITLPAGTLTLTYSWYLAHLNNSSSADFFRVSIVHGGGTTALFTSSGAATNRAGAWATGTSNISAFTGQSVRILVECADASTASLVECGVDDVRITSA